MNIRQLTHNDLTLYKAMHTTIDRDYMIDIFDKLTTAPDHRLFGLFKNNHLVSIAGYTLYPGGYAMLGRLRSDARFQGNGYASYLLAYIVDYLTKLEQVGWIGGYTNIGNVPSRRILSKLDLSELKTFHSFPLINPDLLITTPGKVWSEIETLTQKRAILKKLSEDVLDIYPYECYYPFPYRDELLTDQKLAQTRFYQNEQADRWLIISDDYKKETYAQIRYFWDDYFSQPGLFETITADLKRSKEPCRPWFDFTPEAFEQIPNLEAFDVSDGWVLYGEFTSKWRVQNNEIS